jgi:hypothetical protein
VICSFGKSEYFFERGWTEGSGNREGDLLVGLPLSHARSRLIRRIEGPDRKFPKTAMRFFACVAAVV